VSWSKAQYMCHHQAEGDSVSVAPFATRWFHDEGLGKLQEGNAQVHI